MKIQGHQTHCNETSDALFIIITARICGLPFNSFLRYYGYINADLAGLLIRPMEGGFMDTMTPEQRSHTMSRIKSTDTKIELALRKALWHKGYRYRKNYKALPGSPDIAITKYKIAIFCDSEFFHGYNWEIKKQRLGRNKDYWIRKIERNMARDREADLKLIAMDWVPVHFWGQDILTNISGCIEAIDDLRFELQMGSSNGTIELEMD